MLTKHNLASIVVQQMVQCLLNWIFPLLSTIVVIVGDCVHIYHPRANLCTTLMTSPSPPSVGEDCLEGVGRVHWLGLLVEPPQQLVMSEKSCLA